MKEADLYNVSHYWQITTLPRVPFDAAQPHVKGWSGEIPTWGRSFYWTRFWIDQDMK